MGKVVNSDATVEEVRSKDAAANQDESASEEGSATSASTLPKPFYNSLDKHFAGGKLAASQMLTGHPLDLQNQWAVFSQWYATAQAAHMAQAFQAASCATNPSSGTIIGDRN